MTVQTDIPAVPAQLKKRKGNTLHTTNPFMMTVKTRTRRVINKRGDMALVCGETGEIARPIAGFWEAEEVDSTRFVKLFVNGVKALKELSPAGTKVFEVLYLRVQQSVSKDQIYISFSTIEQGVTPMSEATYTRGMRELIDKGFVAATPHLGLFWLNPDYLWNGDRLTFVREYYKKSSDSKPRIDDRTMTLPFGDSEES